LGRHGKIWEKGKPISDEAIKMLRKEKLIEGRKPHLYVSKQIAGVTDQKVEYSKHKGLTDKKCEALLLDSLKDHNCLTKQEIVNLLGMFCQISWMISRK